MNASIRAAIAAISEDAWTAITYPRAIWDDQFGAWTFDAEVAEIQYRPSPPGWPSAGSAT